MEKNKAGYWEKRIAETLWGIYNSEEEKNRKLLEMYKDASRSILDELYRLEEKLEREGLSRSESYKRERLTSLNNRFRQEMKRLGGKVEEFGKERMTEAFRKGAGEIAKEIGDIDFSMPPKKAIEKMMRTPWHGGEFSSRLWKDTKKLADALNDQLRHGLEQGKTVTEIAIGLDAEMQKGFHAAHRLVRTETMHILNVASLERYKDSGIQKVQFWAAEDERTCSQCGGLHGKVYSTEKAPVLPIHPNCRCTYLPVIEDTNKSNSLLSQEEIIEQAKKYGEEVLNNRSLIRYGNGDPVTDYVNRKLGYDSLPKVVSNEEFESLKKGKQVLYRGVTDTAAMSSGEMVEAFKKGDFFAGRGIYGYGTYTDTDKRIAEYYASENGSGKIIEMILSDGAKTVDFLEIMEEYEKTGIPRIRGEKPEAYQDILGNLGTYASIKGYDAILLNGFQNKHHVVILNRGKVIVKE